MRFIVAILLLLAALPSAALRAQEIPADSLPQGRRVRVTAPDFAARRLSGYVSRLTRDTLVVTDKEGWSQSTIPVPAIRRIDVSGGRTNGAVFGGLIGGVLFGAVEYTFAGLGDQPVADAQRNTLAVGALGALIGAIVGASVSESWRQVFPQR